MSFKQVVVQVVRIRNVRSCPPPPRPVADVRDDYESTMTLSIRSGIHSEISWGLDRLCRLVHNEQFVFKSIPGVIDGLFDWPDDCDLLFSAPPDQARQRRYALESLFVLRNAALHEPNALELAAHSHTIPLILNALHNLDHTKDENVKHFCIIYQPHDDYCIITALTALFSNPANGAHLTFTSSALTASLRYLPLFVDKPLIDACLNYLYCHVSYPSMARAFLLHPEMPGVLRVLASLLLHEQLGLEKTFTLDKTGPIYTAPSTSQATRDHDLTKEELDSLVAEPEPQRCYDWMRSMFVAKMDGELTQVDFWNLYKDAFSPFAEQYPLLVASDVIKNVTNVFPQAQAMVLQGSVQRFVVRGVDRRKESAASERYRCQWDRSQCPEQPFASPSELFDHSDEFPCLWSSCPRPPLSKHALSLHVLTHLSSAQPSQKHPSQSDTITLPSENYPYPTETPTTRPPPPPRSTTITYEVPIADPPSTSLTALLVIRILFRTSFASADAAPRVDSDHFGFPGVVEDTDEPDTSDFADGGVSADEREGERRGRKAFVGIRTLLESVRIRDEALMGWVTEMVDEA
ncbi:hypothetical protein BDZ97DRAFT_1900359 [Flammula alnicola]|nr:hypothetical protein BDZ97DRAFT_1900359 [Flammula alnicola]